MNTIIDFRANKAKWKTTPTTFGWDSILLLEDTPDRLVILGRDHGDDDIYMPWKNSNILLITVRILKFSTRRLQTATIIALGLWSQKKPRKNCKHY